MMTWAFCGKNFPEELADRLIDPGRDEPNLRPLACRRYPDGKTYD
jgi:hypothetical protein